MRNGKLLTGLAIGIFVSYWAIVLYSGTGHNTFGQNWDFTNSGQFGDSFGPLSSLMSAIAAVSALMAYWTQRDEIAELKKSAAEDKNRAEKRDFEDTFFKLLSLFRDTLQQIDVKSYIGKDELSASDAMSDMIMKHLHGSPYDLEPKDMGKAYGELYSEYKNDLGHYFRLFYHILKFIDEYPNIYKITYVRILRATLSNIEMVMIGLNCSYGSGEQKLKPLVERHKMLHNISSADAQKYEITKKIDGSAFGDRVILADGSLTY